MLIIFLFVCQMLSQTWTINDCWEIFARMTSIQFQNETIFTISVTNVWILLSLKFQFWIRIKSRTTYKEYGAEGPVATCLRYICITIYSTSPRSKKNGTIFFWEYLERIHVHFSVLWGDSKFWIERFVSVQRVPISLPKSTCFSDKTCTSLSESCFKSRF